MTQVSPTDSPRSGSFGQERLPSVVDRLGVWLTGVRIRRAVGDFRDLDVGDFGCGYQATFARTIIPIAASVTLVDVTLAPDLKVEQTVQALEGSLPEVLQGIATTSLDVVLCISVLEHLVQPDIALREFHRVLRPGGVCVVNVPTWLGKRALELSAFRLGWSPADEMDDHKYYFDPKDLWPLLVQAGFLPHNIRCFRHKLGLNTFAVCRLEKSEEAR
ncbi:MAG TPA: methyltransferase domain-containing protein [Acidimicrobiales bacterium]|nr:methyltransferase domain-containing protein [Acidimicrobiales bacterium]